MEKKFGTALNCIDGRTQIAVTDWLKEHYDVDYVDLITEPGIDKVLSRGKSIEIDRLRKNAVISVTAHRSLVIAIAGHYDCAANPVSDNEHFSDITACVNIIKSWNLKVSVVGLWIDKSGSVHVVE